MDDNDYNLEGDRPWERRGTTRRDALPDRGKFLEGLGIAGVVLGALGCSVGITVLLGLPLSIAVWVMANRDLEAMHAGSMDREGEAKTRSARKLAIVGTVLNGITLAGVTFVVVISIVGG